MNVNKKLQLNSFSNILDRIKPTNTQQDKSQAIQQARQGQMAQSSEEPEENLINENYQPQDALYNLKHFDGDVIIQNRYGATLRFGSSLSENALNQRTNQSGDSIILGPTVPLNNDPIIVMRVGQQESPTITRSTDYGLVVEDINNDLSSFVLSTNQLIEFKLDGFRSSDGDSYIKLGKTHITRDAGLTGLSGNQSLLTSGRVVVNAKTNNIILSAKQDLISLVSGDTVLDAGNDFVIGGKEIHLVTNTQQDKVENHVAVAEAVQEVFDSLIDALRMDGAFISAMGPVKSAGWLAHLPSINADIAKIKSDLVKIEK